jgi:hypothetical protein
MRGVLRRWVSATPALGAAHSLSKAMAGGRSTNVSVVGCQIQEEGRKTEKYWTCRLPGVEAWSTLERKSWLSEAVASVCDFNHINREEGVEGKSAFEQRVLAIRWQFNTANVEIN